MFPLMANWTEGSSIFVGPSRTFLFKYTLGLFCNKKGTECSNYSDDDAEAVISCWIYGSMFARVLYKDIIVERNIVTSGHKWTWWSGHCVVYFSTGPMHSSLHAKCVLLLNYMFTDILYVYALFACPYVPIITCVATMFIESKDY